MSAEQETIPAPATEAPVLRKKPGRKPKAIAAAAAPVAAVTPVVERVGPMLVKAKHPGTYPRPGETYPRYRVRGEVFPLKQPEDFTKEWMVECVGGEEPELPPEADGRIPQMTGPRRDVRSRIPS